MLQPTLTNEVSNCAPVARAPRAVEKIVARERGVALTQRMLDALSLDAKNPCVGCPSARRCADTLLACADFAAYVESGVAPRGTQRSPTRELYRLIFPSLDPVEPTGPDWREFDGYFIHASGVVQNLAGRALRATVDRGRAFVGLNGTGRLLANVVAEAFLGPKGANRIVFADGNALNCAVSNLSYVPMPRSKRRG